MGFWKDGDVILETSTLTEMRRYSVEDGRITLKEFPGKNRNCHYFYCCWKPRIVEWLEQFGYDFRGYDEKFVENKLLAPFINKPIEAAEENIRLRTEKLREYRAGEIENMKVREKTLKDFDGFVVSLDNEVDVYDSGFSVRILLSSTHSLNERREFVKERKMDLVKWTMAQISGNKKMMNKIGDLRFYRPCEIITLKSPEVEIKFQVKKPEVFEEKEEIK